MCSGNDKEELMSVDKLRYFDEENVVTLNGAEQGLFRINAIKFEDTWYAYSRGDMQEIDFSNFEEFDVNKGKNGMFTCVGLFKKPD